MRDFVGGTLSCLCIAHCALLPLLFGVFPAVGFLVENEAVHMLLLVLTLVVSGPALLTGVPPMNKILASFGLTLMAIAIFMSMEWLELAATLAGSSIVLISHFLRYRMLAGLRSASNWA